jgi:DNA polymerase-3 subunit beta
MRLSIDKTQFLKALNSASHAVASKGPLPLLSNLKLDLNEKGLEVTGSNQDITVKATVPYMIGDKEIIRNAGVGSTLVNAHILTEIVRQIEGAELSIEVIDDAIVKIDDGKSSFKLNCIKAEEYPDIDLEPTGASFEMKCADLTALVEQSAFAASAKEQRPVLTGLNLRAENGLLVATATDSARLARKQVAIDSDVKFSCNVPARNILDIVHLFENAEKVTLAISDKKILFDFDSTIVTSRLIPGDYPVTDSIIPATFNFFLEANAQELLSAMGRVRVLSVDSEPVVKLTMQEDEVEVSAKSDANGSGLEKISTFQFTGERLAVSFNSQFVIDAIRAVKSDDVTICFIGEMKPFVVKNPKDDSVIELITPMRTF